MLASAATMQPSRIRRPGRLPGVSYVGIQRYFLTLCTCNRKKWFQDAAVVDQVRSQLTRIASDLQFAVPAHCLMPDHAHLLVEGTTPTSDLQQFVVSFKQKTGFEFAANRNTRLWQDGYYDRILRSDEATLTVVRYILENPVRAGLVARFSDYSFSGSDRYSLEELAEASSEGWSSSR
jgi:putative transposase